MTITEKQNDPDWKYAYEERIGLLCEDRKPTLEQMEIAANNADEYINNLKEQNE